MNFKKIFALVLCIACFATMLVSCAEEDDAQYWLDKYKEMDKGQPQIIETVDLDFYIIKGEGMSDDSNITKTVQDKMNQYLSKEYYTNLNIKYISEADYTDTIKGFNEQTSGIVLINSDETMDMLTGKLVDIHPYIHGDQYKSHGFGQLNKQITTTLMDAALVEERGVEKLFCVPNNHIIGSYDLIVINKELAFKAGCPYSESEFAELTTWESTEILRNKANQIGDRYSSVDYKDYNPESGAVVTKITNAPFEAIEAIKSHGIDDVNVNGINIVNISKYPQVDDAEVYSSAFAILNSAPINKEGNKVDSAVYQLRAMQVIYAINTNVEIRNLLQYGVENVNYSRDMNDIIVPSVEKPYDMKLEYTGDVFKAYYSETWTESDAKNGLSQNSHSVN